jgi:hypothetical protein
MGGTVRFTLSSRVNRDVTDRGLSPHGAITPRWDYGAIEPKMSQPQAARKR